MTSEEAGSDQVDIHPAQTDTPQSMTLDEMHRLLVADDRSGLEATEKGDHLVPTSQGAGRQLTDDERMAGYLVGIEKGDQVLARSAEVIDPDRCVDERRHSGGPTPTARLGGGVAPPQRRQAASALTRDEGFQPGSHHGRLAGDPTEALRLFDESVIQNQCGSHMHHSMPPRYAQQEGERAPHVTSRRLPGPKDP